jgi:hypothetical protein
MPQQNRVTPFGTVIATHERGAWFGNRGCLHDSSGRVRRTYATTRWIFCELRFKSRRRPLMTPGHYTGLYFLDEATALAAGHRPCAECMRDRFDRFRLAWAVANPSWAASTRPAAPILDAVLHAERLGPDGGKRTFRAVASALPSGTMVASADAAYLLWERALWRWSPGGYAPAQLELSNTVDVLTPASVVLTLASGYTPQVHASLAFPGQGN